MPPKKRTQEQLKPKRGEISMRDEQQPKKKAKLNVEEPPVETPHEEDNTDNESEEGSSSESEEQQVENADSDSSTVEDDNDENAAKPSKDKNIFDTSVTFASLGLSEVLCEICEKLGYTHPTKIQREAIPYAIQGKDIIGLAETGSGKTAAFALPILQHLLNEKTPYPYYALVLAPTRELAVQIQDHFNALGSTIGLKTCCLVGGIDFSQQGLLLAKKPHIIVGTPGRVLEHINYTKGFSLLRTKYLVMDEADRMLSMQFDLELEQILKTIPQEKRTTFLFSATMTQKVLKLEKASLKDPVKCEVASKYTTAGTLSQQYVFIPEKQKEINLAYLLNEFAGKRVMVFVSQNITCVTLSIMLRTLGFPAVPLSGHMEQVDRTHCLRKFKIGERPILIATDVAARGLDIPEVEIVINYDIPMNSKEYVHRVGRTARAGRDGKAITFVTQYDVEYFQKIEELIDLKMARYDVNPDHVAVLSDTVSKALRLARTKIMDQQKAGGKGNASLEEQPDDEEEVLSSAINILAKKSKARKKKMEGSKKKGAGNMFKVKPNKALVGEAEPSRGHGGKSGRGRGGFRGRGGKGGRGRK